MKRLYILEYDFHSTGRYGDTFPEFRQEIFQFSERQDFIERYQKLIEDDFYFDNIKTYCIDYTDSEITDKMKDIMEAV